MNKRPIQPIEIPDDLASPQSLNPPQSPPEPSKNKPDPKKNTPKTSKSAQTNPLGLGVMIFHHAITVFILLLLLGIGVWSYLTFSKSSFFVPQNASITTTAAQAHITQAQLQRIAASLETFEVIHERYPARLEELVEAGLLLPSDLYYPLATPSYHYARHQQSYDLNLIDNAQPEFEFISDDNEEIP